jgi:hypothetical protein
MLLGLILKQPRRSIEARFTDRRVRETQIRGIPGLYERDGFRRVESESGELLRRQGGASPRRDRRNGIGSAG